MCFHLPVGISHSSVCVVVVARESDVVGPTCNVNTTQKIYCSNPERTKRCCLECAAKSFATCADTCLSAQGEALKDTKDFHRDVFTFGVLIDLECAGAARNHA